MFADGDASRTHDDRRRAQTYRSASTRGPRRDRYGSALGMAARRAARVPGGPLIELPSFSSSGRTAGSWLAIRQRRHGARRCSECRGRRGSESWLRGRGARSTLARRWTFSWSRRPVVDRLATLHDVGFALNTTDHRDSERLHVHDPAFPTSTGPRFLATASIVSERRYEHGLHF